MNNIWAPWRIEYITGPKNASCVFCAAPGVDDPLILKKGSASFAIMNRFPYTTGHCLIVPYRHVADITEITDQEFSEIMSLAREIIAATREAMNPDGFNMGCNLGSVAGAGIADHLHFHLVPRWKGDTNFMPVIADTSVISDHIMSTRDKIAEKLPC